MKDNDFEELLPAYLEGALNAEQTARIETWLERSAEARQSLEDFRVLEGLLESRREQVPPAADLLRAVQARTNLSRIRTVMNAAFSFPAISSLLLILFGFTLYIYREHITSWFDRSAEFPGFESLGLEWVRNALLHFSGADIWTVTAVYAGLTIAILLSTSLMLMRFLRD
jgi:anti-sigma factor RsiW